MRVLSKSLAAMVAAATLVGGGAFAVAGTAYAADNDAITVTPNPWYANSFDGWGTSLAWFANATGSLGEESAITTNLGDDASKAKAVEYGKQLREQFYQSIFGDEGLDLNMARYNVGGGNASDVAYGYPFMRQGAAVPGTWKDDATGSGTGIQAAIDGTCDIGLSSRALKDEEKASLTETIVALDGIAIIVNPANPVSDLSVEQIAQIYTGEITNWKDVGGNDAEIVLIGREAGSGTRDGFESIVDVKDSCKYAQELTATGAVISAVEANPLAIGYASLSAVGDTVAMVTVEGVECSEDTVKDGSYKIQRPFVFVTNKSVALSEQAQAFVDFATSKDAADLIRTAGAVPVNE